MIAIVIAIGVLLMVSERLIPHVRLFPIKGWWLRVAGLNLLQLGVVWIGMHTWEVWLSDFEGVIDLDLPPLGEGAVAYIAITFVFYWWHRARHESRWLWRIFHQMHHSATRIETITSFYKHPLEIALNSFIIATVEFVLFGLSVEAVAWTLLLMSVGEYLYHMNIKTPHWWGYLFQRPEMHRIHHQEGLHYYNFSDLPLWDILFGTYRNPRDRSVWRCGFRDQKERLFVPMLFGKDVLKEG